MSTGSRGNGHHSQTSEQRSNRDPETAAPLFAVTVYKIRGSDAKIRIESKRARPAPGNGVFRMHRIQQAVELLRDDYRWHLYREFPTGIHPRTPSRLTRRNMTNALESRIFRLPLQPGPRPHVIARQFALYPGRPVLVARRARAYLDGACLDHEARVNTSGKRAYPEQQIAR
jgi:hypothetical protein